MAENDCQDNESMRVTETLDLLSQSARRPGMTGLQLLDIMKRLPPDVWLTHPTRGLLGVLSEDKPLWKAILDGYAQIGGEPADLEQLASDYWQQQLPVIQLGTGYVIGDAVDQMQKAILKLPGEPLIYQRSRRLSIIARGIEPPKWFDRAPDAPIIIEAQSAYLREVAQHAACWEKFDKRAQTWDPTHPPMALIETLQQRPQWPFPPLEGIIAAPTLRPDGSLLDAPGYDASTGLFVDTNGVAFPPLRSHPTLDDARSAIGRLQEAIKDFPFTAPYHFSAALAAMLSIVCRFTIQGCVPLFAITATTRGSGKGLLCDVISMIGTGRPAPKLAPTTDVEEERKCLFALALEGTPIACIDNCVHPLGSPALDVALTAATVHGRILGITEMRETPIQTVFFATGNNLAYRGDLARRVMPIALDPKMERPEERTDFEHPQLLAWVKEHRPQLLVNVLTIMKAFFEAGKPSQGTIALGSFENWSTLVRDALIWAGEVDPCLGRFDIEAESDQDYEKADTLLESWWACYEAKPVTLSQVIADIGQCATESGAPNKWNDLQDALSAFDRRYDGKHLNTQGVAEHLKKGAGRVIGGRRFVKAGKYKRAALWKIESTN